MSREHLSDRRLNETQESERDGIRFTITTGFKSDGTVGEIFLNAGRVNSALDVLMSDAAIICSIALQFGAPLATMGDLTVPVLNVDRVVEVKCRADGFRELYKWLVDRDILIVKADRSEPLVVLPLKFVAEIAAKAGGH
jgi:hypothetical protein